MRCGKAYFFKGHKYVRWDLRTNQFEYEAEIAKEWDGLERVEAALNWGDGRVYLFGADRCLEWDIRTNAHMEWSISERFPGLRDVVSSTGSFGDGIDAAINWGNGKAYLFKGHKYVRWDIATNALEYEAEIAKEWTGFEDAVASTGSFADGIDAAINWGDGKAYFFKGHKYIRWDILEDKREHEAEIAKEWTGFEDVVSNTGGFAEGIDAAVNWAAPFVPREVWGARNPRRPFTPVAITDRTEFVVHHVGDVPLREDSCAWVHSIQGDHRQRRDRDGQLWIDIGYNLLVDRFGNVFEGRGRDVVGSHAPRRNRNEPSHNEIGIGVCFLGSSSPGFDHVTPHARGAIRKLWIECSSAAGRDLARLGHRHVGRTECPGEGLYAWVNSEMPEG